MATSSHRFSRCLAVLALCASTPLWSREAASTAACQAAAATPSVATAKAALEATPGDLKARFRLADAWSDAGCFNDAVQVLQAGESAHAGDKEFATRLRVARSLVGEEHFFDNIERADAEARLKRQKFRCTSLGDLQACDDALRLKPDDPALLVAQGDALMRAKRPADARDRYRLAAVIAPNQQDVAAKLTSAENQLPASPVAARPAAPDPAAAVHKDSRKSNLARAPSYPPASQPMSRPIPAVVQAPARRYSNASLETQSH